jgi:hypothetical protein
MLAGLLVSPIIPDYSCSARHHRHHLLQPPQCKHLMKIFRIALTMSLSTTSLSSSPPSCRARSSFIMRSPLINVGTLVESYINVLNPTVFSDRLDWTLHVSRSAKRSDEPTAVPIVAIFNWHHRGPSCQMFYAPSDIATGDSALMHCLYHIGRTNYDARVTIPAYRGYWEPNHFRTFFLRPTIHTRRLPWFLHLQNASSRRVC